jgi:hypothetical protein
LFVFELKLQSQKGNQTVLNDDAVAIHHEIEGLLLELVVLALQLKFGAIGDLGASHVKDHHSHQV